MRGTTTQKIDYQDPRSGRTGLNSDALDRVCVKGSLCLKKCWNTIIAQLVHGDIIVACLLLTAKTWINFVIGDTTSLVIHRRSFDVYISSAYM